MTKTVLLAGGGTGGHVYPLVAVADALKRLAPEVHIVFVGTERGIEKEVVSARGYSLELVRVEPIRGRGIPGGITGIFRALMAIAESRRLLNRLRPAVVLTVGGYAAGPVSAVARLLGIPVALLEPNAVMGLSNRMLAPWVQRAYTAFPAVERHLAPSKVMRSGVPIRDGFSATPWHCGDRHHHHILVLGGSQGARSLNDNVPIALARQKASVVVRHQCGGADLERVRRSYAEAGVTTVSVEAFIDDVPKAIREADLVVSRAGASAISEICAIGRASLLVPYPFAAGNHQEQNADWLASSGAAHWVANRDATPERLAEELEAMLFDSKRLTQLAAAAQSIGRPQAAAQIAKDLLQLAGFDGPTSESSPSIKESN